MAMERLSRILRRTGTEKDKMIADGIDVLKGLRGEDVDIATFLEPVEHIPDRIETGSIRLYPNTRRDRKAIPLYEEVAESIRGKILSGEIPFGTNLPVESHLEASFGVGRGTIREALRVLQEEGFVVRRQGTGTFVSLRKEGSIVTPPPKSTSKPSQDIVLYKRGGLKKR